MPARPKNPLPIGWRVKLDLNCDLGEGEAPSQTRLFMRWITSANVACGGHAGDLRSMQTCVRLAKKFGVRLGAHPGLAGHSDFGREQREITGDELELLLLQQVGALERLARVHRVPLHHIKLHGALYHVSEADDALGRRYVRAVAQWWPGTKIYALAGGRVARMARQAGLGVWEEAFADRGYRDNGGLVPRSEPGALLRDVRTIVERLERIVERGQILTVTGKTLPVQPQTICLHSDTPGADRWVRIIAEHAGKN
jgi:UPF0271 protein